MPDVILSHNTKKCPLGFSNKKVTEDPGTSHYSRVGRINPITRMLLLIGRGKNKSLGNFFKELVYEGKQTEIGMEEVLLKACLKFVGQELVEEDTEDAEKKGDSVWSLKKR